MEDLKMNLVCCQCPTNTILLAVSQKWNNSWSLFYFSKWKQWDFRTTALLHPRDTALYLHQASTMANLNKEESQKQCSQTRTRAPKCQPCTPSVLALAQFIKEGCHISRLPLWTFLAKQGTWPFLQKRITTVSLKTEKRLIELLHFGNVLCFFAVKKQNPQ